MAFTVELYAKVPEAQVLAAMRAVGAAWQPSRLPAALQGQGICQLVSRVKGRRFTLGLRSRRYPPPVLAELRGRIGVVLDGRTLIRGVVALPHRRLWQPVGLTVLALLGWRWVGGLSVVVLAPALVSAVSSRLCDAALTPHDPSAHYLIEELRILAASA